ncbi:hypothetical protein Pan44_35370 [Caulifigura coniformis]|uniref:Uncharacterized protein n=1 Tax=Caulifigura coniformis TaxID=2527983 RepID=A0A517SH89_9PLAN|nr:hypothetical protein [Caulifigura coniformis]QDT55493.1 hypothetical protein Pan44_35370 [Caulifigura coniformis]
MIPFNDFIYRACTGGRSLIWDLATKYCELNGWPPHESYVRNVAEQFKEYASVTDPKYCFLMLADDREVVAKFCESHKVVRGQFTTVDKLAKRICEWSVLPLNRSVVRLLLERQLVGPERVPERAS